MITEMDFAILNFIQNNLRTQFGDFIMPLITKLGDGGLIWIVTTVVLICIPKYRKTGVIMGVTLLLNAIFYGLVLKPLIARPRPFIQNPLIELLINPPSGFSFPSGHTASSFTAAAILFCLKNKLWIPSCVLAILIAFSRLYLYVHFPSDVFAGMILGIVFSIICYVASGKVCRIEKTFNKED